MTEQCRFCNQALSHSFLDLGETALANSYLSPNADLSQEPRYPLHVRVCEACFLVQAQAVVPPEHIFSHYAYFSSYSSSWLAHAKAFTEQIVARLGLNQHSRVVEIASNDGYLLRHFVDLGIPCLGVEPAENVAKAAIALGVATEIAFFGLQTAKNLIMRDGKADLVIANNVLAHVPDLNDFVAGLAELLSDNGVLSIEFPHLLKLINDIQFDTIYHEHYCYFSLLSVEKILAAHGLKLFDVQELNTHGGSLRLLATKTSSHYQQQSDSLLKVRRDENLVQLNCLAAYQGFSIKVNTVCEQFKQFLKQAKANNKTIVAYGAAAKGNTFLNYCGITCQDIGYVIDKNPAKQQHLLPQSHLKIVSADNINSLRPDYLLILPWNLADEIAEQMADIKTWGGQFVTAIPSIRVF